MPAISQAFRCFDEVARRGSVRKAAVTLHLTAAAVNQQILNLEAQVGVPRKLKTMSRPPAAAFATKASSADQSYTPLAEGAMLDQMQPGTSMLRAMA